MKRIKLFLLAAFVAFALCFLVMDERLMVETVASLPGGPPPGHTGAPGEATCTACHVGDESGSGTFTITAPAEYTPGQTYQIQVRHQTTDATRRRWGFQLTALADTTAAGTFTTISSAVQIVEDSGRFYVSHTLPGTFPNQATAAQWTFSWAAPAADVGPVVFYAAGNQANNDNTPEGDHIFVTMATSTAAGGATPTPTPTPSPTPTPVASPTPSPSPSPTPNLISTITGRVLTPSLISVRNAVVTLIDSTGSRRTATTSSFGVYAFAGVPHGAGYTLTVSSKRYRFAPNQFAVSGNATIDLVGLE
jgi:hypothetical protein